MTQRQLYSAARDWHSIWETAFITRFTWTDLEQSPMGRRGRGNMEDNSLK